MSDLLQQLWMQILLSVLFSAVCYFIGCTNGALLVSRSILRDDVRNHGSGNAGLTNFYRSYGAKYALLVILVDMGKAAVCVLLGGFLCGRFLPGTILLGKYWAGLCCVLGHIYPVTEKFHGGKGILSAGTVMFFLGWQVAVCTWGAFLLMFLLTRYVSLGSVTAALMCPIATYLVYGDWRLVLLASVIAGVILFAHRANIARLLSGTENKFQIHSNKADQGK